MNKTQIAELIQRRRLQLLVHSCIYYAYNENLVTDDTWAKWALELEKLQAQYPDIANKLSGPKPLKILTTAQAIIYLHVTLGLWVEQNG